MTQLTGPGRESVTILCEGTLQLMINQLRGRKRKTIFSLRKLRTSARFQPHYGVWRASGRAHPGEVVLSTSEKPQESDVISSLGP